MQIRLGDLRLDWCQGRMPTPDGPIELRWWKDENRLAYRPSVPDGYEVEVHNLSGRPLLRRP